MGSVDRVEAWVAGALRQFERDRYTGQVQFQVNMTQGGVSQARMLTQTAMALKLEESPTEKDGLQR